MYRNLNLILAMTGTLVGVMLFVCGLLAGLLVMEYLPPGGTAARKGRTECKGQKAHKDREDRKDRKGPVADGGPKKPEKPEKAERPETPETPETPEMRGKAEGPEAPEGNEAPEKPEKPVKSETPETSLTPLQKQLREQQLAFAQQLQYSAAVAYGLSGLSRSREEAE